MTTDTRTGGRQATRGVVEGRIALSVGMPSLPQPTGYTWRPLSQVARLESGHTPSRSRAEYWDGDIPWIGIRDATANHGTTITSTNQLITQEGLDNSSARLLPAGTVCLSRTASVGYVVQMGVPMATSQDFVNWVCGPELSPDYLKYVLVLEQESVRRFAHGTTHQTMYYPEAKALHALLPSRKRQDAIAEVLGSLDAKIAANTRKESTAESLTEAMHRRAVAAPGTATEPLMKVLTVAFGEPFGGGHFVAPGKGRPLIRIRDLKTFRSQVWTTESRPKEVLVQPGDVVVGMDAEFRPTWWLGQPGLLNQRVCRVTCDGAGRAFVREALRAPMARVEGHKTGTTVIHLNKSDLLREHILWPAAEARAEFDRVAEPVLQALVVSAQERERLAATRDALLPLLMSGKMRVKDAERVVEGVV